jgi:hypothetical protein
MHTTHHQARRFGNRRVHTLGSGVLLALSLLAAPFAARASVFTDIPWYAQYGAAADLMYQRGITAGCSAVPLMYCPNNNVTRAQISIFIVRAIYSSISGNGEKFTYPTTPYFSDVPANHPYFPYVQKMAQLGITSGTGGGMYSPDDPVTNNQLAVFTVKARAIRDQLGIGPANLPDPLLCSGYAPCSNIDYFSDVPREDLFHDWIQRAYELVGDAVVCQPGLFCMNSYATRGQVAFNIVYGILVQAGPGSANYTSLILPAVVPAANCYMYPYVTDAIIPLSANDVYTLSQSMALGSAGPSFNSITTSATLSRDGVAIASASGGSQVSLPHFIPNTASTYTLQGTHTFSASGGCSLPAISGSYQLRFWAGTSTAYLTLSDPFFATQAFSNSYQAGSGVTVQGPYPVSFSTGYYSSSLYLTVLPPYPGNPGEYKVSVMSNTPDKFPIASLYIAPGIQQTITSVPPGRSLTADGVPCTTPCTVFWNPGTSHTLAATPATQPGATDVQYVFANWSDAGAATHTVTAPSSQTTYTANFTTQYRLTTSAGTGGTISPATQWFNQNTAVPVTAAPNANYAFSGFTGALSGTTNPQTLTMTGPLAITATFAPVPGVLAPSFSPPAGNYTGTQTVTLSSTTTGASIRYTMDGSTPSSTSGLLYAGPFTVAGTMTVKAIAYKAGMTDSGVSSAAYTITPPATDFNLTWPANASFSVLRGDTASYTLTVSGTIPSGQTVTFAPAQTPSGTHISFNPPAINGAGSTTVTITADAAEAGGTTGNFPFQVKASSNGIDRFTATATFAVQDFNLVISPAQQAVSCTGSATYTIGLQAVNGFNGAVSLLAPTWGTDSPPGSISMSPPSISGSDVATLTVTRPQVPSCNPWIYRFTIRGGTASASRSITGELDLNMGSPPDFTVGVTPSSQTIAPGGTAYVTVTATSSYNFVGSVVLQLTGLPSGWHAGSAAVNVLPLTPGTAVLAVTADPSVLGSATFNALGTLAGGSSSHQSPQASVTVQNGSSAAIQSPTTTSSLPAATPVTFVWDAGTGVTDYQLTVGSSKDAADYASYTCSAPCTTQKTWTTPAADGPVYVTLKSQISGTWYSKRYWYGNGNFRTVTSNRDPFPVDDTVPGGCPPFGDPIIVHNDGTPKTAKIAILPGLPPSDTALVSSCVVGTDPNHVDPGFPTTTVGNIRASDFELTLTANDTATTGSHYFYCDYRGGTSICNNPTVNGIEVIDATPNISGISPAYLDQGNAPVQIILTGTGFGANYSGDLNQLILTPADGGLTVTRIDSWTATEVIAHLTISATARAAYAISLRSNGASGGGFYSPFASDQTQSISNTVNVSLYDATPIITSLTPNPVPPNTPSQITIVGVNFGVSGVLTFCPNFSNCAPIPWSTWSQDPGSGQSVTTASISAPAGRHYIQVTSKGRSGLNFAPAPNGGSSSDSSYAELDSTATISLTLTRTAVDRVTAVGSPDGGTYRTHPPAINQDTQKILPPPWGGPGVPAELQSDPSAPAIVLRNPANPNTGPTPGLLKDFSTDYTVPDGSLLVPQPGVAQTFPIPTFGVSCYNSALESDWGGHGTDCRGTEILGVNYAGTTPPNPPDVRLVGVTGPFCSAFLATLRLNGSGKLIDGTLVQHDNGIVRRVDQFKTADNAIPIMDRTIARDRKIMPKTAPPVNVILKGIANDNSLEATDTGGAILNNRIDLYRGIGRAVCAGWPNPMAIGLCSPGTVYCPAIGVIK